MKRLAIAAAATCALLAALPASAATLDPKTKMYTLETPHFRVNYEEGYDEIAQKGAAFAEEAYDKVTKYFNAEPSDKVEFTMFDHEDEVNGLALPYVNASMYVYLTTPDSDLLWGRYDDWFKLVITHEFTHIMHFETVEGAPKLMNKIFGRVMFPNLFQPTFLIEGLAVTTESLFTSEGKGGRGNDGYFDMYLRGDVLNNRQLSMDQVGGYYLTDFPGGDGAYVYGTFFYKYISLHYGADKPPAIAHAYAEAPWLGVDAAVAKVIPGHNCQQIFDEMLHWVRRRAQAQMVTIKQEPVTPTVPLTHTSYHHHHPIYLPDGRLVFISGQRHGFTGVFAWDGKTKDAAGEPVLTKLFNKSQYGTMDVSGDGKYLYYQSSHGPNNYSSYDDIYRINIATGAKEELTEFQRMNNPGVSPDGKFILVSQNGRGDSNLVLLDDKGKKLRQITSLTDSSQFTAPRWSPDGKHVVVSAWRGGSRDLYMIDTATWLVTPLWKDSWVDVGPKWSPDGKYVVFASDRAGGVWNLFAWDWQARQLSQMTNVLTGVIEPAISPDGKTVAMCYCNGHGYDIHTMPFDPSRWKKVATPIMDPAVVPYKFVRKTTYPSHPYNPLPSMMPKFWSPIYQSGQDLLGVFTIGYDILLTNTVFALAGYTVTQPTSLPEGASVSPLDLATYTFLYQNSQLENNFSVLASGASSKYGIPLASGNTLNLYQRTDQVSLSTQLSNLPSPLTNSSYQTGDQWNLSFNVRNVRNAFDTSANPATDYNKAAIDGKLMPVPGRAHSVSLQYKYNDNGKYGYSHSPEFGTMNSWGIEVSHPYLGSETEYYRAAYDWRHYQGLPWTHHTLAFRSFTGLNLGKPFGDFYLGGGRSVNAAGTPDIRVASDPDDLAVALRGYPFASLAGNTAELFSAEYRFPLLDIQRGAGPLPFFAERLYGSVFSDTGLAFTNDWLSLVGRTTDKAAKRYPELGDVRSGVGAELRLNFKIANNPLNTVPIATVARSALPFLNAFNDSAGVFRLGLAQPVLPGKDAKGNPLWTPIQFYTEFGTFF
ncbi:MAG: tolB protein precursor [Cyanobacteria bacterium RYN_339]|nr:tolB protein precursor [Cyanobacteria bacterium RYN_339]